MIHVQYELLSPTYGVLMIGVLFAVFFQGILTVQVHQYYQDYPEDPKITRYFVATLWALDFIHLILIIHTIYYYLVTSWGNAENIRHTILPLRLHLVPIAFSSWFSQLFLLCRIWVFSQGSIWLVGPVFICSLSTFAIIFVAGVLFTIKAKFPLSIVGMVVTGTVTDTLIATLLCYFLFKRSEETRSMRVTSTLVNQIVRYTLATSTITSLFNVAALITWITLPNTYVFVALHFSSGRIYTNVVLANLNGRRRFRQSLNHIAPSFDKSIDFSGSLGAIRRTPKLDASAGEPTVTSRLSRRNGFEFSLQPPLDVYPARFRHSLP